MFRRLLYSRIQLSSLSPPTAPLDAFILVLFLWSLIQPSPLSKIQTSKLYTTHCYVIMHRGACDGWWFKLLKMPMHVLVWITATTDFKTGCPNEKVCDDGSLSHFPKRTLIHILTSGGYNWLHLHRVKMAPWRAGNRLKCGFGLTWACSRLVRCLVELSLKVQVQMNSTTRGVCWNKFDLCGHQRSSIFGKSRCAIL